MRRFILIPIWALTSVIKPFLPKTHPWKNQDCSLDWFDHGATDNAIMLGCFFWFQVPLFGFLSYIVFFN